MDSSPKSTMTSAAAEVDVCTMDWMPVYVKELIVGGAAGAFSKTAVVPLERVKILMQTRTKGFKTLGQSLRRFGSVLMLGTQPSYSGIKDAFRKVYLEGGIRSLYRGVGL